MGLNRIWIVINYGTEDFEYIELIPLSFGIVILSFVLTKKDSFIIKIFSNKWLVYLGTISYGIYMIHAAVWWLTEQILQFILKIPTITSETGPTILVFNNIFISNLISLVGIFIVIYLAHLSYHFLEKKFSS